MAIRKISQTPPTMASIVNAYSTSENDGYSCKYINDSETYSTSEVKTNKVWIDGKPIYRKVITQTISSQGNVEVSSLNIDRLISTNGWLDDGKSYYPLPYVDVNYSTGNSFISMQYMGPNASWNANHIYIVKDSGKYGDFTNLLLILEYTKTTD